MVSKSSSNLCNTFLSKTIIIKSKRKIKNTFFNGFKPTPQPYNSTNNIINLSMQLTKNKSRKIYQSQTIRILVKKIISMPNQVVRIEECKTISNKFPEVLIFTNSQLLTQIKKLLFNPINSLPKRLWTKNLS